MKDRLKALFMPFAPSLAHVSRCLALAEAWQARGHAAVIAIGAERRALVDSAGFEARTVPEVSGARFLGDRRFFSWLTPEYMAGNLAAEGRIMAEVEPDIVVTDFRFTACLAARRAGLPSASILHGAAMRFAYSPGADTAGLLLGDTRSARGIGALRAHALRRIFPIAYRSMMRTSVRRLAPALRAYGCPLPDSVFGLLRGDAILAADLVEFLPPELPPRTHITGPLFWSGWERPTPWLEELDGRPLIYVTMGSTVEGSGMLVKILRALGDGTYNVVVSTGSVSLPKGLELPPCVHVFPTVPGMTVARRSAAVVHHGGHETLMQALAAGVPSLIFPGNPDQILVAQQAQALRVGSSLRPPGNLPFSKGWQTDLSPAAIRTALDRLLDDPGRRRAGEAFRQKAKTYGGAGLAAEKLEWLAMNDG